MPASTSDLFQLLGYALCEDRGGGRFELLGDPPGWFREVWGPGAAGDLVKLADAAPFLESFLSEAAGHWNSSAATPLDSGLWVERTSGGREIPLEARAWRLDGRRILSLHSPEEDFQNQSRVLQTARDSALAHERLLKEIQKKEILLHCIVHDLSQPLTAMQGCFDVLAHEAASPSAKRVIEVGREQSNRQDAMIREVLQAFAADMQSAMDTTEAATNAPDILGCAEETVVAFSPVFQSRGAKIRLDPKVDRRTQWSVVGEKSRLMRIFANLVENALRHAPKGSAVTIGLVDDGGNVKACVDDEGPGLPKGFQSSDAFALFSKGKKGSGKAGMGLYFCRITVERWSGTIGCESLPRRGARFWFRLARATSSESASAPSPAPAKAATRSHGRLKILVADDDAAIRELMELLIHREGHTVTVAPSGTEALEMLARRRFDLVFLDEEMPGMTGVEVIKRIRARETPNGPHQVTFALTGNATPEDRKRLLGAGFDACFGKPFRMEDLREAAGRFFSGSTARPRAKHESADSPPDSSLLARVGGDPKLLRSVIRTFLKDYPLKIRRIKRAVARKDANAVASAAHALKGAIAIFDANDAVEKARELQQIGRSGDLRKAAAMLSGLDEAIARLGAKLREYAPTASLNSANFGRGKRPSRRNARR